MEPNRLDTENTRVETSSQVPVERVEVPTASAATPSGPSSAAVPSQVTVTPSEGNLAAQYIEKELAQFRTSLQRTQIFGSLLLLATLGYMGYLAYNFQQNLQPQTAAQIASGAISERVTDQADIIAAQMKERIPQLIATLPDTVIKNMPGYRQQLETQINGDLAQHSKAAAENLSLQLDDYLLAHKDEMKAVLDSSNDSAAVKQMGGDIEKQFLASLQKTDAGGGETVKTKLDKTLQSLHQIDALMAKLAANKNLTPQEQKARRAIAIMTETANREAPGVRQIVTDLKNTASQSAQSATDAVANSIPAAGTDTNDVASSTNDSSTAAPEQATSQDSTDASSNAAATTNP